MVGASIGIALAPKHGNGPHDLIKKADLALYRAKAEGRNGYAFFDAQLAARAEIRHQLERDLRAAILDNTLEVQYQPIFDARTLEPCAVEALARWRHPEKGFIPPTEFIPLAEETGLIIPLGEQVLQKACSDAAAWPAHIKVAVNLSPLQFKKGDLPDAITRALAQSALSPDRLELEITETLLIERYIEVVPIVQQLKKLGISIVLDDFGTGYSSLSYLAMLPFDKIKIERTFTQNLTSRAECVAIFSAVRTLGYALDMETTAEGVETEEQLELVRAAGVNSVQGYLFGGPYPASDLNLTCFCIDSSAEKAA